MQPQRIQLHSLRQGPHKALGEVGEHILAGGLVVHQNYVGELTLHTLRKCLSLRGTAHNEGVVEAVGNLAGNDALELAEVHNHSQLRVIFVCYRLTLDGDKEAV